MSSSVVWKICRAGAAQLAVRHASCISALRLAARMRPSSSTDQLALVQRVDELGPAVEVDRVGVAEALVDQPVLDHARRHAQQHQQVLLRLHERLLTSSTARHLAGRVVDRHRRAGERVYWLRKWSSCCTTTGPASARQVPMPLVPASASLQHRADSSPAAGPAARISARSHVRGSRRRYP
jgi:hypothetical protein